MRRDHVASTLIRRHFDVVCMRGILSFRVAIRFEMFQTFRRQLSSSKSYLRFKNGGSIFSLLLDCIWSYCGFLTLKVTSKFIADDILFCLFVMIFDFIVFRIIEVPFLVIWCAYYERKNISIKLLLTEWEITTLRHNTMNGEPSKHLEYFRSTEKPAQQFRRTRCVALVCQHRWMMLECQQARIHDN